MFQGRRHDGHHWVIESDLDIKTKHIRLGVQENRMTKYHDAVANASVAVLDFGLTLEQEKRILSAALELVSVGTRYSLREIAGTVWAMRHPKWQPRENLLAREKAFYCSAYIRHVFAEAGLDVVAGIAEKNTAPEHIATTLVPHTKWILTRGEVPGSRVRKLAKRVKAKLRD